VCGAGGVMAWERGRGEGREGAGGGEVDYAPAAKRSCPVRIRCSTISLPSARI
jgi:hypothetical protein